MAAASIPSTSGIKQTLARNKQDEKVRPPTVEELLIQIENHLYQNTEQRASLLIAVWSCLGGQIGYCRNIDRIFHMLYRESAMMIFSGNWPKMDMRFKRGLARALIQYSNTMGSYVKGSESLCSALVMATYDPWGEPVIRQLLVQRDYDQNMVKDFIKSEPHKLLLIRVECLVNAHFEEAAIRLLKCCLHSATSFPTEIEEGCNGDDWRWSFMEWLLRLLFRKRRLNDLVAESSSCSCHDGVRLIYRTFNSEMEDSEPLTETLINLFLVRDLLFKSSYCCTSELMKLWCEFQAKKQRSVSEIQEAARKLLVGHASSSAQFYLFVDVLWGKFGISLLPLYLEMYIRGLTSDLNFLEAARQTDNKEYVIEIENHMAAMYFKLFSLFNAINKEIALECLLSAFSLDPTKERLEWIKKLSLQITKDKALKAATTQDDGKHKQCNRSGCPCNCPHPTTVKRRSVIMCDQAIQVGDDSFLTEDIPQPDLVSNLNQRSCDTAATHCISKVDHTGVSAKADESSVPSRASCVTVVDDTFVGKTGKVHNSQVLEYNGSCDMVLDGENQILSSNTQHCKEDVLNSDNIKEDVEILRSLTKAEDVIENSLNSKDGSKYTSSGHNHVSEDCNSTENCINLNNSGNKVPLNYKIDKVNHLGAPVAYNEVTDGHVNLVAKNAIETRQKIGNININDTVGGIKQESSGEKMDIIINDVDDKTTVNHNNNSSDGKCTSVELNGSMETEAELNKNKENLSKSSENQIAESEKQCDEKDVSYEKTDSNSLVSDVNVTNNDADTPFSVPIQKENSAVVDSSVSHNLLVEDENKISLKVNENEAAIPLNSSFEKFENLIPFSHIVLDSKFPGISSDLLSDFVTVLESLRNKQLKSSCKWSQIKHLCEDYMENVNNARCTLLNMQLNGSVDSEADSTSEFDLQDFEFQQSNNSVVEDRCADKTHVFKRFMNSDKAGGMATYVNLSDIHCPQIPLEKLFYTDHSSSHGGHKKKHKRHRNHDKAPGKLVLKKFRHGLRAERDLAKHKKKKKRKAKKGKGHMKKHRFTHGKVNKAYLKNKKKKHKLKKKKEGNSGFISGDYCSDFSSAELMRLVKEHSNSYSKVPATTSKHPHSSALVVRKDSSSEASDEPQRKKRKVSFSKKRNRNEKCREKHKHTKSKSSKHKKTILVESCNTELKNAMEPNPMANSVNDYSHIVKFSSVKKMEAVQIRQRSVALNLSKVNRKPVNKTPTVSPCESNPQFQQFVQQNFESYTPEDIMKMQLLMARQQPDVSSMSNSVPTANNQAVLKYVCSKTTSYLAQSSNCVIGSDSETSKSPVPAFTERTSNVQKSTKLLQQPQNLSSNVKHFIIDANNTPYQLASGSSVVAGNALIPVSLAGKSYTDIQNLAGKLYTSEGNQPSTITTSQVQAFKIPVAHNQLGGKLVGNKIVIPLPAGHLPSVSGMSLVPRETPTLVSTSGNQSNVIIVKNGNTTQIIQNVQQPSSNSCIDVSGKVLPFPRGRVLNPIVSRTVPKIIKQAAKKLSQPVAKRTLLKSPMPIKPAMKGPIIARNLTCTTVPNKPDVIPNAGSVLKPETSLSAESLLVQRAIAEAKRAIAESSAERIGDQKRTTEKRDLTEEKSFSPGPVCPDAFITKSSPENVEPMVQPTSDLRVLSNSEDSSKSFSATDVSKPTENEVSIEVAVTLDTISRVENDDQQKEIEEKTPPITVHSEITNINDLLEQKQTDEAAALLEDTGKSSPAIKDIRDVDVKEAAEMPTTDILSTEILPAESPSLESDTNAASNSEATVAPAEKIVQSQLSSDKDVSTINAPSEPKIGVCSTSTSVPNSCKEQPKQLEPINEGSTGSNLKTLGKTICLSKTDGTPTSEVPTRSFTSISDAVRFSLMDMDDATDSVENQVLQAFQVSQESSPNSPAYDNNSTNEGDTSAASPSAVILTTPQSTSTTELNVSRVSQRFESSMHGSQTEKFTECQSTVSRTTTWILEDSSVNDTSQNMGMQKSPEVDSSGEGKDDDKPKKKKKRKDRMDRDPESAHKFWCEICHKGFFSAYNLRRHCRNVHKMNLPRGSSDLPFGPKSTPELSYANNSQCHQHVQQGESSSSEVTPPRLQYGTVQQSCVSPKGSEFMLQSPTRENKTHEFSIKPSTSQHAPQMQSSDFQMQTPPRISSQPSSTHVSTVTPTKDFRLQTPTTVSTVQMSPNKSPVASKSTTSPKFQRLPTSCSTTIPQISKVSQISLCSQPTLQQQRQLDQLQPSALMQSLPGVACQAQQLQAAQCPHFQANKQIVQQRIGQLQLMHHTGQMPQVQHAPLGIPKQTQVQQFKKCSTAQQSAKMTETEQIQQAAQIAQTQQILANQHLQKLMHIRQNAIVASGAAPQLSLGTTVPGVQGSASKTPAQCFQSQLAAARQAAAAAQLPTPQRSQGTSYTLTSHDSTGHQFFSPSVQTNQEQTNCPHAFTAQNVVEFSTSGPSYPTIRLSSETNDGLEDLEQFLLENMPWSGDQTISHGLAQQSGNRPSSADSLTLAIPSQASTSTQNRAGAQFKIKSSISRPKPRKPIVSSCSKNLLGNLGRGVKKKSVPKKTSKSTDTECIASKPDVFSQSTIINQQPHTLNLLQRQCSKEASTDLFGSKPVAKNIAVSNVNETDSSDSVQCINITPNLISKNTSMGINFNTFPPSEKNLNPLCGVEQNNSRLMFDMQSKNSFLDQCNLVNKNCSTLDDKSAGSLSLSDRSTLHTGSPFIVPGKDSACGSKPLFYRSAESSGCAKRLETPQDVFLGQPSSEKCELSSVSVQRNNAFNVQNLVNVDSSGKLSMCQGGKVNDSSYASQCRGDGSVTDVQNDLFLDGKTASQNENAVSEKTFTIIDNAVGMGTNNAFVENQNGATIIETNNSITNTESNNAIPTETYPSERCIDIDLNVACVTQSDNAFEAKANDNSAINMKCTDNSEVNPEIYNKIKMENNTITSIEENIDYHCKVNEQTEKGETDCKARLLDENVKEELEIVSKLPIGDLSKRDINFNEVTHSDDVSHTAVPISELGGLNSADDSLKKENDLSEAVNINESPPDPTGSIVNVHNSEMNNSNENVSKLDTFGGVYAEVPNKYSLIDVSNSSISESAPNIKEKESSKFSAYNNCEKEPFMPKFDGQDKVSSQENKVPNGLSYLSEGTDNIENEKKEQGSKRIALRIHKSQDSQNDDMSMSYFVAGKPKGSSKTCKKTSQRNKANHRKREVVGCGVEKTPPLVLDINSNIQKTVLYNEEKKVDVNGTGSTAHQEAVADNLPEETQENEEIICIANKRHASSEEVSPGRLRLRDTTKTSVKRLCPCCVDSRLPKKCRAVTKLFVPKVQNTNKTKSTLKTRNSSSASPNAKVNTRSSQRLRSRNNAIS